MKPPSTPQVGNLFPHLKAPDGGLCRQYFRLRRTLVYLYPPKRDSPLAPGLPTSWLPSRDNPGCLPRVNTDQRVWAYGSAPSRKGTDWIFTSLVTNFSIHAPNGEVHRRAAATRILHTDTPSLRAAPLTACSSSASGATGVRRAAPARTWPHLPPPPVTHGLRRPAPPRHALHPAANYRLRRVAENNTRP